MQKSKFLTFFFLLILGICSSHAQDLSSSDFVTSMYDAQCELIVEMKSEKSTTAEVYADMKINGVDANDFKASRYLVLNKYRHSNNELEKKAASFFDGKDMTLNDEYPLFNDYVKARYSSLTNATMASAIKPQYGARSILSSQMSKRGKARTQVSVTSNSPESVTGGSMWMFSNGIRVIYKEDKKARDISYTFMFRGGFGSISGLQPGQGAYIQDILPLYKIKGMSGASFRNMLALNGISMDINISLMDMRISGYAPSDGLPLLLEAMIAIADDREPDPAAYQRYLSKPRHSSKEAVIDSLFRPDFEYNPYKYEVSLPSDLMERAESEYFSDKFSNFDDGLIILTGNLSEYQMQSVLRKYLGAFRTEKKYAVYPQVQYQQHPASSYRADGAHDSITYAKSFFMSLTSESYLVTRLSEILLQNAVRKAFPGKQVRLDSQMEILPYERYMVMITVDGVGAGDVERLHQAVSLCAGEEISADDLKAYKSQLVGIITEEMAKEDVKTELAISRYTGRKDLLSNYKDRLDKIKADQVQDILSAITNADSVDYIGK